MSRLEEALSPVVAREVLAILMKGLAVHVRTDGGALPGWAQDVCQALDELTDAPTPATVRRMSASGPVVGMVDTWVTTGLAAGLAGCSERHVRRLAATGRVRARQVGARTWLVDRDSLATVLRRSAA